MNVREVLDPFMVTDEGGLFTFAEVATTEMVCRRLEIEDRAVALAIAFSVWAHRTGHSCLELSGLRRLAGAEATRLDPEWELPPTPTPMEWRKVLRASPAVRVVTEPGSLDDALASDRPLVLFDDRLHSQRQFADELSVATSIERLRASSSDVATPGALDLIDRSLLVEGDDDHQNLAARAVLSQSFTVLTGGPGTGKTHTLTRILLAYLVAAEERGEMVSIAVAAPTGKAAQRAKELLASFVAELRSATDRPSDAVLDELASIVPSTVHRLLGRSPGRSTRFAHDADHPLPHDLVVIDETSMVPLQLMARLLEAIDPHTHVLLVGDDAQLESVESGSVLRDLVLAEDLLPGSIHALRRVRRVGSDNPIAQIAPLVREGKVVDVRHAIGNAEPVLRFVELADGEEPKASVISELVETFAKVVQLAKSEDPAEHAKALAMLSRSRMLCGARRGPLGIDHWNDVFDRKLKLNRRGSDLLVVGRAVLITVNSPRVGLVNGDVGLVVATTDGPRAAFDDADGGVRYVALVDLPEWERALAMTVHKSQGSEYRDLLVLLLPQKGSPLLTRELVYTGLTRAAGKVIVIGSGDALDDAVRNRSSRVSALSAFLTA